MVIKLTYNATGKSTLVNMKGFKTAYRVSDPKGVYPPSTKIEWADGTYVNVTEDLQTVFKLIQEYEQGVFQDTDWVENEPQPVRERFEQSFQEKRRERNYNHPNAFNQNRY